MTETLAPANNLYQQFAGALTLAGGTPRRAADSPAASEIIVALMQDDSPPAHEPTVWAAPMLREQTPALLGALGKAGISLKHPHSAAEVRHQAFGLSVAQQAIAETGSVVLVERELADRAVGLVTESHIVICRLDDLAPSLDDAATTLAQAGTDHGSYATLVTGPSRTADIERQLTVGVQGPARLHVIVVESLS
jgi:L-lactate dehydrogenase complex protein LldG